MHQARDACQRRGQNRHHARARGPHGVNEIEWFSAMLDEHCADCPHTRTAAANVVHLRPQQCPPCRTCLLVQREDLHIVLRSEMADQREKGRAGHSLAASNI